MNNLLVCSKCNKRLDVPKILPCGATVCSYCVLIEPINDRFTCPVCKEQHWFPKDDFPTNIALLDLLSNHTDELTHSQEVVTLKENLNLIHKHIEILTTGLLNGSDQIKEHCKHLRSEVQLATEIIIQQITDLNDKYIEKINDYESNCLNQYEHQENKLEFKHQTEAEFVRTIEKLKVFHVAWNDFLKNHNAETDVARKANKHANKLIQKAERNTVKLDNFIFDNKLLNFTRNVYQISEEILGEFSTGPINIKSSILCNNQWNSLMRLCGFKFNQKWELLYRASIDDFESNEFHLRCDSKRNTLIIVKTSNGYVFGGYTEQDWSGESVYKLDDNAFVFSLINDENKEFLFRCEFTNHAIYCHNSYGPTFGAGHDFCIMNNSNVNFKSYSNPSSYSIPRNTFLAGEAKFQTKEIEVYCK